ncbi:hypothetical protein, partial [Microbulbifer sp.]|uniref:hypothetical protein n=1 Tax=Microbulbifer sp. TaxID=1908541 RepID=UPI002F957556
PQTPNPGQEDFDGDGIGDTCDNDLAATCESLGDFQPITTSNSFLASGKVEPCSGCSVTSPGRVTNNVITDAARLEVTAGAGGYAYIDVTKATVLSGRHLIGFLVEQPSSLLDLVLQDTINISTWLNDTATGDSSTGSSLVAFKVDGAVNQRVIVIATTLDFDRVRLSLNSLLQQVNQLDVYMACTAPL